MMLERQMLEEILVLGSKGGLPAQATHSKENVGKLDSSRFPAPRIYVPKNRRGSNEEEPSGTESYVCNHYRALYNRAIGPEAHL